MFPDGLRYSEKSPELAHAHPKRPQKAIGKRSPSFPSEAAYFLGQRALPPPNSFHFSEGQGLRLDLRGRTPWDPSF